jgi:hopene-associated glycosyltransferase HpnB
MTAAIASASLAIWIYLIAARGGFWRAAERDDDAASNAVAPTSWPAQLHRLRDWLQLPPPWWGRACPGPDPGSARTQSVRAGRGVSAPQSPTKTPVPIPPPQGRREQNVARSEFMDEAPQPWPAVAAVIPARDEADVVAESLGSLLHQDYAGPFAIVLVDDQSRDGTAEAARACAAREDAADRLTVVPGKPLPPGWAGKLWAMKQGIDHVESLPDPPAYLLLTDADIAYAPDTLTALVGRAQTRGLVLTSLMAKLRCETFAERALIPAFIFFFQLLYPFARVNRPTSTTAAAAGGCMLVRRDALAKIGGIEKIRTALIDDCALGRELKRVGPIWLGLTRRARSLRAYPRVADVRKMVARSAYHQLGYSPLLLAATAAGLALTFLAPPLLALFATGLARALGLAACALMALAFQPMLRLYRVSPLWGLALPAIAAFYLAFTLDSAYQHWRGRGGLWKGRVQADLSETR